MPLMPASSFACVTPRPFGASGFAGASSFGFAAGLFSGAGSPQPPRRTQAKRTKHVFSFMIDLFLKLTLVLAFLLRQRNGRQCNTESQHRLASAGEGLTEDFK